MKPVKLYHNPRCSKSRQALSLLQEKGVEPEICLYLEAPLSGSELTSLLRLLDMPARDLLRTGEEAYKRLGLADPALVEDKLIAAMIAEPKLMQRPIASNGARAVVGRPPERVLELLA